MEKTNLNLIPEKEKPIVNASQFDDGRVIKFILMDGEGAYIPVGGESVVCNIRKPDNNIVTISCTLTSIVEDDETIGSYVDVALTEQANACVGEAFGELVLTKDDDFVIGTCNFILAVERSPIAGGVTSTTVIDDLYTQVEAITIQVIGDDYYTKTQVDDLLDLKADAATTYTKTEVDAALDLKADKSTTYTKTQVDSALALKADASQVYTRSQTDTLLDNKADKSTTYTKTQVDNALALKANSADLATVATTGDYDDLTNKPTIPAAQVQSDWEQSDNTKVDYIKNKPDLSVYPTITEVSDLIYDMLPVGTATGAVANFDTELGNAPLIDCVANIVAIQPSGTPTPSSPLAISGYTGVIVSVADENMSVQDTYSVSWQTEAGTVYGGNLDLTTGVLTVTHGKVDLAQYDGTISQAGGGGTNQRYFRFEDVTPYPALGTVICDKFVDSVIVSSNENVGVCVGSPSGFDHKVIFFRPENSDNYNQNTIKTYIESLGSLVIVYPLATPVTYQLTPVQVQALLGVNNVFNDTNGDTEVKYKDSIQHYIDTRI